MRTRLVKLLSPLSFMIILSACTSTAPSGRQQLSVPGSISLIYTSVDNTLQQAMQRPSDACKGRQCEFDRAFDRQVARLGMRLSQSAYEIDKDLKTRIPQFNFRVVDTPEPGSNSDAAGTIEINRGSRNPHTDETVVAYLIARELGHVMARHHEENSAASVFSTILVQLFIPAFNLARSTALIASSAVSSIGTNVITTNTKPDQLREADQIAMQLMNRLGWSQLEIAQSLEQYAQSLDSDAWSSDIRLTAIRIDKAPQSQALLARNFAHSDELSPAPGL